jgi:hypothetical protein
MDEIDNMDERFHLDEVENKNVVLHYGWNFKTWVRVTIYPYDWISSTLTWIIFMWSIYLEELSFIHVVNVNHMIMFSSIWILSIVDSNHIINFHSCVKISSMSFIVNHVVNFIQVTRFKPMIQLYSCDQVHPYGKKYPMPTLSNFHYLQNGPSFFLFLTMVNAKGFSFITNSGIISRKIWPNPAIN